MLLLNLIQSILYSFRHNVNCFLIENTSHPHISNRAVFWSKEYCSSAVSLSESQLSPTQPSVLRPKHVWYNRGSKKERFNFDCVNEKAKVAYSKEYIFKVFVAENHLEPFSGLSGFATVLSAFEIWFRETITPWAVTHTGYVGNRSLAPSFG